MNDRIRELLHRNLREVFGEVAALYVFLDSMPS